MQTTHVLHSHHVALRFPLLDSFPGIYAARASGRSNIATRTSLSIDSSIAESIHSVRSSVGRSVGLEVREELFNRLSEMADSFRSGWHSDDDDEAEEEP